MGKGEGGTGKGESTKRRGRRPKACWNCGATERDEDGACLKCRDPDPKHAPEGEDRKKRRGGEGKA